MAPTRAQAWDECAEPLHSLTARYAEWFGEANDLAGDRGTGAPLPTADEMRTAEKADFFGEPAIVGTPADAREVAPKVR